VAKGAVVRQRFQAAAFYQLPFGDGYLGHILFGIILH
jgi:hypothetical protein